VPELIEVELYRRAAERALGRRIATVETPDAWYLKGGLDPAALTRALLGRRLGAARRHGKLLLVDVVGGDPPGGGAPTLGLRFGMTGRLVVDGVPGVDGLVYGASGANPDWDRFALRFDDGGDLVVSDARRLGGVMLDPPLDGLGPEASSIEAGELVVALGGSRSPLKACLLDQARLAGLGNLLVDETLWRAGLAPDRPAGGLGEVEVAALAAAIRSTVAELSRRGGSHTGDLQALRDRPGVCPRDGAPLRRGRVGGRATVWCSGHQA